MKKKGSVMISILFVVLIMSCGRSATKPNAGKNNPYPVKYENELFSVNMPRGWEYDDSGWHGLEDMRNSVELHSPNSPVWFHIVKTFIPFEWKNIEEATNMALSSRSLIGDNAELTNRIDNIEVGGYPASILYFSNYVDGDTIIQKQYVAYLEDSHITMYFNENFLSNDWVVAEAIGDGIIKTIKLKKVTNPLEEEGKLKEVVQSAIDNNLIDEETMEHGRESMKMIEEYVEQ